MTLEQRFAERLARYKPKPTRRKRLSNEEIAEANRRWDSEHGLNLTI